MPAMEGDVSKTRITYVLSYYPTDKKQLPSRVLRPILGILFAYWLANSSICSLINVLGTFSDYTEEVAGSCFITCGKMAYTQRKKDRQLCKLYFVVIFAVCHIKPVKIIRCQDSLEVFQSLDTREKNPFFPIDHHCNGKYLT